MTVVLNRRRFRERSTPSTDHRVNREGGVIRTVRIGGESSVNNRRYPARVLQAAIPLYEGARVYLDHDYSRTGNDRPLAQWIGVLENVRFESNALWGDIRLRKESQHFAAVIEAAEGFSRAFGLSHVVDCDSHRDGKFEVVDEIVEVISVDVVSNPAMNRGLFESVDPGARGGQLGGGMDPLELDALFQKLPVAIEALGDLPPATSRNLALIDKGQDPEPMSQDDPPSGLTPVGFSLIDNFEAREIRDTLTAMLRWWTGLPVKPEAKAAADAAATSAQIAALEDRIAKAESRHRELTGDAEADRILEARKERNRELRAASHQLPATPLATREAVSGEQVFEARRRRNQELRQAKGLRPL